MREYLSKFEKLSLKVLWFLKNISKKKMAEIDALIALCDQTAVSETSWANTNRLGQFKEKTAKSGDQRQRRKERLERQKRDREKVVDKLRGLDDENEEMSGRMTGKTGKKK